MSTAYSLSFIPLKLIHRHTEDGPQIQYSCERIWHTGKLTDSPTVEEIQGLVLHRICNRLRYSFDSSMSCELYALASSIQIPKQSTPSVLKATLNDFDPTFLELNMDELDTIDDLKSIVMSQFVTVVVVYELIDYAIIPLYRTDARYVVSGRLLSERSILAIGTFGEVEDQIRLSMQGDISTFKFYQYLDAEVESIQKLQETLENSDPHTLDKKLVPLTRSDELGLIPLLDRKTVIIAISGLSPSQLLCMYLAKNDEGFRGILDRDMIANAARKRMTPSTAAQKSNFIRTQKLGRLDAIYNGRPPELSALLSGYTILSLQISRKPWKHQSTS
ncbi:hypothetical protein C8Q75DRAFT_609156 [Abortiporus biennis]|nr:hypothetical protein C8Q75DRAFT_609156 [Abortiporus biennis]